MDELIPWQQLENQIEPFYPKAGNGRRPYPLSTMLRIHFMQNLYNMAVLAFQSPSHGGRALWDYLYAAVCWVIFRRSNTLSHHHYELQAFTGKNKLGRKHFKEVHKWLSDSGIYFKEGTIVDATIIEAASSTKNKAK